jgi:flagellar basal body-associated protein FliL
MKNKTFFFYIGLMKVLAKIIITILLIPVFILIMVGLTFWMMYEAFWNSEKWKANSQGQNKV